MTSSAPSAPTVPPDERRRLFRTLAVFALAWLPALLDHAAIAQAAALQPPGEGWTDYLMPRHSGLLYLRVPLVVASACVLFLSPGMFLALVTRAANGPASWTLLGLSLSLVVLGATTTVVQAIAGFPVRGTSFALLAAACALACFAGPAIRALRGRPTARPMSEPYAAGTVLSMVLVPSLVLVLLSPKFHWENFNGDGIHAFESARLLLFQPLPFWPATVEDFAPFPGLTSMLFTFPVSWFIRLFGELEASARLPFLLFLVALYAGILAVVEQGRPVRLRPAERWVVWLGLLVYTAVMAFSATYNPYAADIALPATQDTLALACLFGFLWAFIARRRRWILLFLVLTITSLPSGALLIGHWLLAAGLSMRPRPWSEIGFTSTAMLVVLGLTSAAPRILAALGLPLPGSEYSAESLLGRFAYLQWADWRRIAFLVIPCGIVPVAALLGWRRLDPVARALALLAGGYFGLFYVQAYVSLHHFAPAMVLPLAVYWRSRGSGTGASSRRTILIAAAGSGLALFLSLPRTLVVDTSARTVGGSIEDRTEGYERVEPAALRRADILLHLFPYDFDPAVPHTGYGGSPHVWHYYAHRALGSVRNVNYVMQSPRAPPPPGMRRLASHDDVVLYVGKNSVWERHRRMRPPTPAGSPLYFIPRETLFRRGPAPAGPAIVDVKALLRRFLY